MFINPRFRADRQMARAFDAAFGGSYSFLISQLEKIDTEVTKPFQAVTHPRDIDIETGGGFPEWIAAYGLKYASSGNRWFGLTGTETTDIGEVQADVVKGLFRAFPWQQIMTLRLVDMERIKTAQKSGQPVPISLQQMFEEGIAALFAKASDYVTYLGFLGNAGLVNNPAVPETAVPTTSGGKIAWADKTPAEILADVNFLCNAVIANSGYDYKRAMPNRMLVPYSQFSALLQPMTVNGVAAGPESTLNYIERNCIAKAQGIDFKINPLPADWISGIGAGSPPTDRAVVYRKDKENLYLPIPTPLAPGMTAPNMAVGGFQTLFFACIGSVVFKSTQTMMYGDGI